VKKIKLSQVISKLEEKGLHKTAENLKRVVKGAEIISPALVLILKKAKFRKMKGDDFEGYAGASPGSYIYEGEFYDIIVGPGEDLSIQLTETFESVVIEGWEERPSIVFRIIKELNKDKKLRELSALVWDAEPRSTELKKLEDAVRNRLRRYERL